MLAQQPSTVPYVDESNFANEVMSEELPVLVMFHAQWSQQSAAMANTVQAFAQKMTGKVKCLFVDVDRSQMLTSQLQIQAVPTTMLFVGGRIGDAKPGPLSEKQLQAMVEPFLPKAQGAIPPAEAHEIYKQGQISFVDTRDEASYKRTHLPGAVNMPLEMLTQRLAELHMLPGTPVIYCRAGKDSQQLSEKLAQQGMAIPFIEGGLLAWEIAGLPVERA